MGVVLVVGQGDGNGMGEQQLQQQRALLAGKEEAQLVEAELGESHLRIGAPQTDAQAGHGPRRCGIGRRRQRHARKLDRLDLERP